MVAVCLEKSYPRCCWWKVRSLLEELQDLPSKVVDPHWLEKVEEDGEKLGPPLEQDRPPRANRKKLLGLGALMIGRAPSSSLRRRMTAHKRRHMTKGPACDDCRR